MKTAEDETSLDLSYNDEPQCPYCGYVDTEFSAQGYMFPDSDGAERWDKCQDCDKDYKIVGNIEITYDTYRKLESAV